MISDTTVGALVMVAMSIVAMAKSFLEMREARLTKRDSETKTSEWIRMEERLKAYEDSQLTLESVCNKFIEISTAAREERKQVEIQASKERADILQLVQNLEVSISKKRGPAH